MSKTNVAFILGGLTKVGGIGRVTSILANELSNNDNFDITLISFYDDNKENLYVLDDRINHIYLHESYRSMTKSMITTGIPKLRKILKSNNIDIAVACGALFYPIVLFSTYGTKIKTVSWEHSNVNNKIGYKFQMPARWLATKMSDVIVTLTKQDKASYHQKYKVKRIEQIYNPVDQNIENHIREYSPRSKRIISVGRLSYQKNFENLLDIANILKSKGEVFSWDIFGEGEDREKLENKIEKLSLENYVTLKGKVSNLYDLYNDYSILVMTSRFEGFPMTLLEGMSFGLPLISYDIETGPNEIIIDSENGYLVKNQNTMEMAQKIMYLLSNPTDLSKLSSSNLELKSRFSLTHISNEWVKLFKDMVGY